MSILIKSFKEDGYSPHPISEEYSRALSCFSCLHGSIDVDRKNIYLVRRIIKPMTGWWWIGGRMGAGDTKKKRQCEILNEKTGLKLSLDRWRLVGVLDYR